MASWWQRKNSCRLDSYLNGNLLPSNVYQFISTKLSFLPKLLKIKRLSWRYPSKISLLKDLRKGYPCKKKAFSLQVYENGWRLLRYPAKYPF
jgi:hypothetical protein